MKIYRVHHKNNAGESIGYVYCKTITEAKNSKESNEADNASIEETELAMNQWDLISYLNHYAKHPNNG